MIRALVVDDTREMADSLCQMLSLMDVQANAAYGSRPGIQYLNENTPEIVFMDINMPGLGGLDVISYMQREPRLANVPIIVVTSDDQPETAEKARMLGAQEVIIKPATYEALEIVMKRTGVK